MYITGFINRSSCLNITSISHHDTSSPGRRPLPQSICPVPTSAHKPNPNHYFSIPSIIISTSSSHRSNSPFVFTVFCDNAICSCLSAVCRHVFSCAFEWRLGVASVTVIVSGGGGRDGGHWLAMLVEQPSVGMRKE